MCLTELNKPGLDVLKEYCFANGIKYLQCYKTVKQDGKVYRAPVQFAIAYTRSKANVHISYVSLRCETAGVVGGWNKYVRGFHCWVGTRKRSTTSPYWMVQGYPDAYRVVPVWLRVDHITALGQQYNDDVIVGQYMQFKQPTSKSMAATKVLKFVKRKLGFEKRRAK